MTSFKPEKCSDPPPVLVVTTVSVAVKGGIGDVRGPEVGRIDDVWVAFACWSRVRELRVTYPHLRRKYEPQQYSVFFVSSSEALLHVLVDVAIEGRE